MADPCSMILSQVWKQHVNSRGGVMDCKNNGKKINRGIVCNECEEEFNRFNQ
jgi:hypothetical protein